MAAPTASHERGRPAPAPRPYTPNSVRRQIVLEEHDVSPDGTWAVVVRRRVVGDAYESHLWLVPLTGRGRTRRLTDGPVRDSRPRIRPDGRAIAFRRLRRGAAEHARDHVRRLMLLALDRQLRPTREPRPLTDARTWVSEAEWAPDGRRIAFTAEAGPPRFIVGPGGSVPDARSTSAPLARRIRRIDWRYDEEGHLDRWEHLFLLDRLGARPRRVTEGDWGVSSIAWAPDGERIAFTADRQPEPDLRPRTSIWTVPTMPPTHRGATPRADTDPVEPTEILALGGHVGHAAWSPDGRWLAAVGVVDADALDDVAPELVVVPADGSGGLRRLAPDLDRPPGTWHDTDLNGWMNSGQVTPAWAPDGRSLVVLISDRGRTTPWRFPMDPVTGDAAGPPTRLIEDATADAAGWSVRVAGEGSVTALAVVPGQAQELHAVVRGRGSRPGGLRRRTTIGSAWQRGHVVPDLLRLEAPSDGGAIETWVASPPGAGRAALPTIVDVHGGPLGAWSPAVSLEVLILVSAGYRVVLPNIHGSATYGRAWIRPQLGDWGGVDAADVHRATDHVVEAGLADPERLGVLGLSYGGFMVNWLVGTTDRFRAAVSENGVANQINAWANSDTGPEYCRTSLLGDPFTPEGIEKLWRQSPLRHVTSIRTPLLMLQAEADQRCPAADNEQLFIALRLLGREVEYVLYSDESHVYATTGRPDRRVDRMSRMLDWFDGHLKG